MQILFHFPHVEPDVLKKNDKLIWELMMIF